VYLGSGDRVLAIHSDRVEEQSAFDVGDDALALAPTPSGDRVFVSSKASRNLRIINRYEESVTKAAELPGFATELRMDPLGRWLLARPESGDSAWVVSVADGAYIGTVRTQWRPDLPTVSFDGTIATLRSRNVVFVEPVSGKDARVIDDGADDTWYFVRWNGFRPRAKGIDQPVLFNIPMPDPDPVPMDVTATTPVPRPLPPDSAAADISPSQPTPPERRGWLVSFATVLSSERAAAVSASVNVGGRRPRIVRSDLSGTTVYRVLMGPYRTRDEAERIGRESQQTFWVYEEVP
jgi:cell division septation protein DedD